MRNRCYLFFVLLLACKAVNAQGYFCIKEGTRLEYTRKYHDDGKFRWRHILKVDSVKTVGEYLKVYATSSFFKQNGKSLYGDVKEQMLIDANDNLWTDMGQAMASYIESRIGLNMSSRGILSSLPADVRPGDTLQSVIASASLGPVTYTVRVFDRRVLREETISVPAGTFRCVVIGESRKESGPGHNRQVYNLTWYSKDVGYVRHDTYIKGKLNTVETLESIR